MNRYVHITVLAVGAALTFAGLRLTYYSDVQAIEYNRACDYYRTGDIPAAALSFERSINAYDRARGQSGANSWLYPPARRRFAALARFYRADAFFDLKQPELALNELIAGLRANPGDLDLQGIAPGDLVALLSEQCDMSIDLELLVKTNPQLGEAAGQGGSGKGKDKKPGQSPGRATGRDPNDGRQSTQPGMPTSIDDI